MGISHSWTRGLEWRAVGARDSFFFLILSAGLLSPFVTFRPLLYNFAMDEKRALDRPLNEENVRDRQNILPVAHTAANVRTRRRRGFFHLCLLAVTLYYFLWMPFVDDDDDSSTLEFDHKSFKPWIYKYHFEKHMQADVDQLVAGSLESS